MLIPRPSGTGLDMNTPQHPNHSPIFKPAAELQMKHIVNDSTLHHIERNSSEKDNKKSTNSRTFLAGEFMSVHDRAESCKIGG